MDWGLTSTSSGSPVGADARGAAAGSRLPRGVCSR